uniref:Uncharacterized protein n=1 Tax=Rhizophora mucronata TaxID=61149 RepID=A0A2P2PH47_RHIMU
MVKRHFSKQRVHLIQLLRCLLLYTNVLKKLEPRHKSIDQSTYFHLNLLYFLLSCVYF